MDWDHARVFLAVARTGQILGAARQLKLDHATVSRRMDALEKSLGAKLLERRTNGCRLTASGEAYLATAERIESEFLRLEATLTREDVAISGSVRIGAPDGFGTFILARQLGALMRLYPALTLQLVPLPRVFSLAKREADLAVTIDPPVEGRLHIRKLTDYRLSLYASRDYLAALGRMISTPDDLKGCCTVTYVPDLLFSSALDYTAAFDLPPGPHFECAGILGQMEAVRTGAGIGILHDYAARDYPELVKILPERSVTRTYWLVSHDDVREFARVRRVYDFIVDAVANLSGIFQ